MPSRQPPSPSQFRITADVTLTPEERSAVGGGEAVASCALYFPFSTPDTQLFWVKAHDGGRLAAAAPVVRLRKRKATDMLRPSVRRWFGPILGPLSRKTTLLLDTAFMAYDACSPFLIGPGVDPAGVKRAISAFLKSQKKVDTIWISEPPAEAQWAAGEKYHQFHTLPMVHIALEGRPSLDDYVASLPKKRRRNFRHEQETFAKAGATIEIYRGVIGDNPKLHKELMALLRASREHTQFNVPYNDVLTHPQAIAAQRQIVLTAHAEGQMVGFMSLLQDGDRLMQCHGGLDYEKSHKILAYHNLISAAIERAITLGCKTLSLGPMTNETKRRAGGVFLPIVSSLWNRLPGDAFFARKVFAKNFEVYRGELEAPFDAETRHA